MKSKRTEIINAFKAAEGKTISGEELGDQLGISRTMVCKYIKGLREDGYEIQSSPKKGYTLKSVPKLLYPEEILSGLNTTLFGKNIHYFDEAGSSNDIAKKIASTAEEGTIVVVEQQTGGRGRLGRKWASPKGGIWFSIILKPKVALSAASRLTLTVGLSVTNTLRGYGIDAKIKWPNDVLINGKKVSGILTEVEAEIDTIEFVVIGVGINANMSLRDIPEDLRENSTTIRDETGKSIDRVDFLQKLLHEMEQQYIRFNTQPFSEILNDIIALSDTIGKDVKVTMPNRIVEGRVVGISKSGALLLKKEDGDVEEIIAGRCIYSKK
ncbi:biotin--[acetyl-CoA-carboxylase] ligase [Methanolapillus millepedarum]|uniref:Bifunctional ligase/repressor BirA n=1 Tax=Methanolapillus millepedarum TaxID=3028296 RepID=A0AA96ZV97_9EURY|nr:Bifunctional ligase/repressor BirA [Methanosarcinaceae archaeon Ac7]